MQFLHPEFNYTVCSFAIKELFSYGKSDHEAIVQKKPETGLLFCTLPDTQDTLKHVLRVCVLSRTKSGSSTTREFMAWL